MVSKSALGIGLAALLSCATAEASAEADQRNLENTATEVSEQDKGVSRKAMYSAGTAEGTPADSKDEDSLIRLGVAIGISAIFAGALTAYAVSLNKKSKEKPFELSETALKVRNIRPEDLDSKLEEWTYLRSEVEVETDGSSVVYVGEAMNLHFYTHIQSDILGGVRLTKFEKDDRGDLMKRWEICPTDWNSWDYYRPKTNLSFVSDGETRRDEKTGFAYRCALRETAGNMGIHPSTELFELVFGPIDARLRDVYRRYVENDKGVLRTKER